MSSIPSRLLPHIFACIALFCGASLQAQTQIWSQTVSAGTPTPTGKGRSVLKMSNGDYVACYSVISGTSANVRVIRTDGAGTILWTRDLDKGRSDDVNDMVADSAENIYVSMRPGIVGSSLTHLDWSVTKLLGSTGDEQWTYIFVGATPDGNDEVFGLAVAADGNIFAVGNAEGGCPRSRGQDQCHHWRADVGLHGGGQHDDPFFFHRGL